MPLRLVLSTGADPRSPLASNAAGDSTGNASSTTRSPIAGAAGSTKDVAGGAAAAVGGAVSSAGSAAGTAAGGAGSAVGGAVSSAGRPRRSRPPGQPSMCALLPEGNPPRDMDK